MMKRRHKQEENHEAWLMSYADLITLLLSFFIIFVSTSEPKQERLTAATRDMRERFGSLSVDSPFTDVYHDIQGIIARANSERTMAVEKTARGLRLEFAAADFFSDGSTAAEMPPEKMEILKNIVAALQSDDIKGYHVTVEGHTDDAADNAWGIGAARAAKVVKLLAENGVEAKRMNAVSFGATRPLVPNENTFGAPIPENRARNSRVVITIEQ